jgi:hypothetical protein
MNVIGIEGAKGRDSLRGFTKTEGPKAPEESKDPRVREAEGR